MPRSRRKSASAVQVTVTLPVPMCSICREPATVRGDVVGADPLLLCDACYRAWTQSAPGDDGAMERLRELRG